MRDRGVSGSRRAARILQGARAAIVAALIAVAPPAWAAGPAVVVKHGETVTIDGVRNIVMRADQAKGGILLLTGGDGRLKRDGRRAVHRWRGQRADPQPRRFRGARLT